MIDRFDEEDFQNAVKDLANKRRKPRALPHASHMIRRLMARKDFIQVGHRQQLDEAWRTVVGDQRFARTRCVRVARGCLEVIVGDSSTLMQLTFERQLLLKKLKEIPATNHITTLRFSTGTIETG